MERIITLILIASMCLIQSSCARKINVSKPSSNNLQLFIDKYWVCGCIDTECDEFHCYPAVDEAFILDYINNRTHMAAFGIILKSNGDCTVYKRVRHLYDKQIMNGLWTGNSNLVKVKLIDYSYSYDIKFIEVGEKKAIIEIKVIFPEEEK